MSKHGKGFTQQDKARLARTETKKFGHIPKGGLAAEAQHQVDTRKEVPPPAPAPVAPKR